jgi:hypothetical protein
VTGAAPKKASEKTRKAVCALTEIALALRRIRLRPAADPVFH